MSWGLYSASRVWRVKDQSCINVEVSLTLFDSPHTRLNVMLWCSLKRSSHPVVHLKSSPSWEAHSCALAVRRGPDTGMFWSRAALNNWRTACSVSPFSSSSSGARMRSAFMHLYIYMNIKMSYYGNTWSGNLVPCLMSN